MHSVRKSNFGAGPAALNESVLREFNEDLINFRGSGVGVGELSHRSELFEEGILGEANDRLARLAGISLEDWTVLWMSGGGTGQFAAIPLNFSFDGEDKKAVYLVTGVWSEKAAEEAKKLVGGDKVIVVDLRKGDEVVEGEGGRLRKGLKDERIWVDELNDILTSKSINYCYYCDNETVDGVEIPSDYFQSRVNLSGAVLIVDASSNFLSRELPRAAGVVFAGVQKNLGAAGVTVVLLKRDLLGSKISPDHCPSVLDYKLSVKNNSMLNTPPVMAIHLCNLVLKDLLRRFKSLKEIDDFSRSKSDLLYEAIEEDSVFYCPVAKEFRSRMNVIFKGVDPEREEAFLKRAEAQGLIQLRGHRSVGGLRASLYNAVTLEEVRKLIAVLKSDY